MIEDATIERDGFSHVLSERRDTFRSGWIACPHCQLRKLLWKLWEQMRLPVEKNLQTMLDFPQQRVRTFQNEKFLVGEAPCLREVSHRLDCITATNARKITTVEQLQK